MSEPGAVIDIVGLEGGPAEFLAEIILFIGTAGRTEKPDAVPAIGIFYM